MEDVIFNQIKSAVGFASHVPRYREILGILFKYGFGDVLKLVALQRVLGIEDVQLAAHETGVLAKPPSERMRLALEELGPTFVKFGQIISSRRDLVTDEYYLELCKLQDNVPTFPGTEAKKIIRHELGHTVGKLFGSFETEPISGASIAQVHAATLKDGTKVAVKVQRPDIEKVIHLDLEILQDLAKLASRHVPGLSGLNPVGVVEEFSATLLKELDFTNDAVNAERFAKEFEGNELIKIPAVYRELSTARVLTMEFISGDRVDNAEKLTEDGIDPIALADNIADLIYQQIFEHGFFHGDPHPGNMTVLKGGVIGLYDYGMMGSFSVAFRASVAHMIAGLAEKNHQQVMRSILDMSEEGYTEEPARMLSDVEAFSDQHLNRPLRDINLGFVLNKLLELLRSNHLRMKGAFYLGVKALTQVEAIGRSLNPDLNFITKGEPYATKIIADKFGAARFASVLQRLIAESVDFLEEFPHDFRNFYQKIKHGKFSVPLEHKIDPEGFEPLRKTLDSIANRLTNAILASSILICSSILVLSGLPPKFHGVPVFGAVGLLWGGLMCFRLVWSIWKHGGL